MLSHIWLTFNSLSIKTDKILKQQLIRGLRGLNSKQLRNVLIAYEPVWSVGTNDLPTNREIRDCIEYIPFHFQSPYHIFDISENIYSYSAYNYYWYQLKVLFRLLKKIERY